MKIGDLRESFSLSRLYIFNMLVLSWVYLHDKILKENVVNLKTLILGGNKEFVDWNVFPSESLKFSDTATTNSTYFFWLTWLVFKKIFMSSNEVDSPHQRCKLSVLFNINRLHVILNDLVAAHTRKKVKLILIIYLTQYITVLSFYHATDMNIVSGIFYILIFVLSLWNPMSVSFLTAHLN